MLVLVALTTLVIAAAIAVTQGVRSRAEAVIAASLVFNGLIIAPIYLLGSFSHLNRVTLGFGAGVPSFLVVVFYLRSAPRKNALALLARFVQLAMLPIEGIRRTWQQRSLLVVGATATTILFPYMLVISYLAPTWRDWDALWYHEPITGFAIQNQGFAPIPLQFGLQGINAVHRLCEMTQLWFAIYGGRRVIELANPFFMPLLAASMFVLARRYTKDVTVSVGAACALVLIPGFLRLVQTTMVDPQSAALLLAAAFWVTEPKLDRRAISYGILGLTLAAGAKIWSVVPIAILSMYLLVRILRRRRALGVGWSWAAVVVGSAGVVGMEAFVFVRNLVNFGGPLWPTVGYENARLGIHWKGGMPLDLNAPRAGINFNDTFDVFYKKMTGPPFSAMGPGHTWQVNDYGFAFAWVVLPISAFAAAVLAARWLSGVVAVAARVRPRSPSDEAASGAMVLAVCATASLAMTPAIFIGRYHVPSVGMLIVCLCWLAGTGRSRRLVGDVLLFAQLGSLLLAYWAPKRMILHYLYDFAEMVHWVKTPFPEREFRDLPGGTMISPIIPATGLAREREIRAGDVVAFEDMDYPALLWNNEFSNKIVWLGQTADPIAEANRLGAVWVYTRGGTLTTQLQRPDSGWELVGVLEAEGAGSVYRKKNRPAQSGVDK